jgi:hypothetical protein
MKKNIFSILPLVVILILVSCKSEEQKAQDVAYKYSKAMANYDIDEAEKYATQETKDITIDMARSLLSQLDSSYILSDTPATVEISSFDMLSDTSAIVSFTKNTPIKQDLKFQIEVRKRNGKWKAHAI